MRVRTIRCGIPDCDWGKQNNTGRNLTPALMAESYNYWYEHLVERHGLNPNTSEATGIDMAELWFDHVTGARTTLRIAAKGIDVGGEG